MESWRGAANSARIYIVHTSREGQGEAEKGWRVADFTITEYLERVVKAQVAI